MMRRNKSNNTCSVKDCNNTSHNAPDLGYFRYPRDTERAKYWAVACKREDLLPKLRNAKNHRVCGAHFEKGCIKTVLRNRCTTRLIPNAVPIIFPWNKNLPKSIDEDMRSLLLCDEKFSDIDDSSDTNNCPLLEEALAGTSQIQPYDQDMSEAVTQRDDAPQNQEFWYITQDANRSLQLSINQSPPDEEDQEDVIPIQSQLGDKERALIFLRTHCNERISTCFETRLNLKDKCPQEYMNSEEYKEFAPSVYFLQVNHYLSKMFSMHSKPTLQRASKEWEIPPDFNDFMFSLIEARMGTLTELERHCILCVDAISIKEYVFHEKKEDGTQSSNKKELSSKSCVVIVAKGLFSDWEQPIIYFFMDNIKALELSDMIQETVLKLKSIQVTVHAIVSNQTPVMVQFMKHHSISSKKPHFLVNKKKIFYFINALHLLLDTRSKLFKCRIGLPGGIAEHIHIINFYVKDKSQSLRLAPKLTSSHVFSEDHRKVDVKMAAELLSATVGAALMTHIGLGGLPSQAYSTANFVVKMDRLFDIFNSRNVRSNNEFKKPFTASEVQIDFLDQMFRMFRQTRLFLYNRDITSTIKLVNGWKLSIKALKGLHNSVKNICGTICTRQLNSEGLDNFFRDLQARKKWVSAPRTEVSRAFKAFFFNSYFQQANKKNSLRHIDAIFGSLTKGKIKEEYDP